MPSYLKFAAAALTAVLPLTSAQTFTNCNPLHQSCPPDPGLTSSSFVSDFTAGQSAVDQWTVTAGTISTGPNGAEFTINGHGDSPTIQTPFYFFFGKVDVVMRIAPGTGIVSSIVMESDDLDEVDWEGLGGENYHIETNYFGKGDTTTYNRATYPPVTDPVGTFHTYTVDWQKDYISWFLDGNLLRTLHASDAEGGSRFPQTPMNLRIGVWAGGDPTEPPGTRQWAGGMTDFSQGPFTMYIKSVHIENENPAKSYTYGDNSGSWESIQFDKSAAGAGGDPNPPSPTTAPTEPKPKPQPQPQPDPKPQPKPQPKPDPMTTTTTAASPGSGSGSGSVSFTTSISKPSSSAGSGPKSTPGSGSSSSSSSSPGSMSTPGSGSSTSSVGGSSSGAGSSASATPTVGTGSASALTMGLPLAFVGLVAALLQL